MRIYATLLFFIITLSVLSCRNTTSEPIDGVITIDAPYDGSDASEKFNSLFRLAGYTALETNDESLIGRITKVMFYNDEIFILDRSNSIIRFSKDGRHLHTYAHFGEGPAEYVGMEDFDIKNDTIHILDMLKKKIIMYTLYDEFCGTYDVPSAQALRLLDNGIALYKGSGLADGSQQDYMGYSYVDDDGEHAQIPQNPHMNGLEYFTPCGKNRIFGFDGLTFMALPFNETIFQIDPSTGEAHPKYNIDTGLDFAITPEMNEQQAHEMWTRAIETSTSGFLQLYAYYDLIFLGYARDKIRRSIAFTPEGKVILNGTIWHDANGLPLYAFLQYDSPDNSEKRLTTILPSAINNPDHVKNPNDLAKEIISHITDDSNPVLAYYERINENF